MTDENLRFPKGCIFRLANCQKGPIVRVDLGDGNRATLNIKYAPQAVVNTELPCGIESFADEFNDKDPDIPQKDCYVLQCPKCGASGMVIESNLCFRKENRGIV